MQVKFKGEYTPVDVNVSVNDRMKDFVVVDSKMNEIRSYELKGIKLILSVPSVDTSVCSMELSKFVEYIQDQDVTLISISQDLPFALDRWCQANRSDKIIAASDFRYHDFERVSGLLMKKIGLFSRSVLIVDENNKIRYLEIVEDVSCEPNYEKVIQQLKMLKN